MQTREAQSFSTDTVTALHRFTITLSCHLHHVKIKLDSSGRLNIFSNNALDGILRVSGLPKPRLTWKRLRALLRKISSLSCSLPIRQKVTGHLIITRTGQILRTILLTQGEHTGLYHEMHPGIRQQEAILMCSFLMRACQKRSVSWTS